MKLNRTQISGFPLAVCLFLTVLSCSGTRGPSSWNRADQIHDEAIVIDAHAHPQSGGAASLRLGEKTGEIEVDFVTMKEGGLDAVFFSVPFLRRSPAESAPAPQSARVLADIESLKAEVERYGELAEMARSPEDVRRIHESGKRAVLLSIETDDPFGGELGVLRRFHEAGVRMITLPLEPITDPDPAGGDGLDQPLNDFGTRVIEEMNRLGIIIDISHAPDTLQLDIIRTSAQPVVASHSCARALNDVPREIPDAIIRALAEKGGVMAVTFFPGHISPGYPDVEVSVEDLVDHIDHIVGVAGIDHVAFGSDFLGSEAHTTGLESAAGLPSITSILLERGYSRADVEKVLGGNLLRLFEAVQRNRRN